MKKLFIIRHAKSSWEDVNLDDFDRPLNEKGLNDAAIMAKFLKEKSISFDSILTSPASRAINTAEIFAKELNFSKNLTPNQYIYEPFVNAIVETLSYTYDDNNTVALFGHNPGVSTLAYTLCNAKIQMKTCSIIEIEFSCDSWLDISKNNAKFISYTKPKDLINN
jgi:phosphohistidine phosphatase